MLQLVFVVVQLCAWIPQAKHMSNVQPHLHKSLLEIQQFVVFTFIFSQLVIVVAIYNPLCSTKKAKAKATMRQIMNTRDKTSGAHDTFQPFVATQNTVNPITFLGADPGWPVLANVLPDTHRHNDPHASACPAAF